VKVWWGMIVKEHLDHDTEDTIPKNLLISGMTWLVTQCRKKLFRLFTLNFQV
jgi:hypothetical protein